MEIKNLEHQSIQDFLKKNPNLKLMTFDFINQKEVSENYFNAPIGINGLLDAHYAQLFDDHQK